MRFTTIKKSIFYIHFLIFLSVSTLVYAQQTVSGTVSDSRTGEAIKNVFVLLKKSDIHFHTLQDGSFVLKTTVLPDSLFISATGYEQAIYPVDVSETEYLLQFQ